MFKNAFFAQVEKLNQVVVYLVMSSFQPADNIKVTSWVHLLVSSSSQSIGRRSQRCFAAGFIVSFKETPSEKVCRPWTTSIVRYEMD